jgi:hypothetical protein
VPRCDANLNSHSRNSSLSMGDTVSRDGKCVNPTSPVLQVGENEGPKLPKSATPIRIMRRFSRPTNFTRCATRPRSQATGLKLERDRDDDLGGAAALVALVAAHPNVSMLTQCESQELLTIQYSVSPSCPYPVSSPRGRALLMSILGRCKSRPCRS